ncbi:hypothetical protein ACFQFG_20895 [Methylobacterium persicinum]
MKHSFVLLPAAALSVVCTAPARAAVYLTLAEAQRILFPGASLTPVTVALSSDQVAAIEAELGVTVRNRQVRAWKASTGAG